MVEHRVATSAYWCTSWERPGFRGPDSHWFFQAARVHHTVSICRPVISHLQWWIHSSYGVKYLDDLSWLFSKLGPPPIDQYSSFELQASLQVPTSKLLRSFHAERQHQETNLGVCGPFSSGPPTRESCRGFLTDFLAHDSRSL